MKYFFGFCVLSFSLLIYVLNNPTNETIRAATDDFRVLTSAPSATPAQAQDAPSTRPSLQAFSSAPAARKKSVPATTNADEHSNSPTFVKEHEDPVTTNRQELKINALNELIRAMPDKKLSDIATSNFNKETIDYEWGMAYEQKISAFFSQNPTFSNFSPDTVECRSENCQIVISAADKDQLATISSSVIDAVYSSNNELTKNALYVIDEQTNTLRFYFGRNKEVDSIGTILQ